MNKNEKASVSLKKIICLSILVILIFSGIGVMASNVSLNNVKIILSNGYEMTVITSKTNIAEILDENNVVLTEEERTVPEIEEK